MVNNTGAISGGFSGGLAGMGAASAMGMSLGPLGIAGFAIGAFTGYQEDKAKRGLRRAQRAQERAQNEAIARQAGIAGERGTRFAGSQIAAMGAAGVEGASSQAMRLDTMYQTYRDKIAMLSGISPRYAGSKLPEGARAAMRNAVMRKGR